MSVLPNQTLVVPQYLFFCGVSVCPQLSDRVHVEPEHVATAMNEKPIAVELPGEGTKLLFRLWEATSPVNPAECYWLWEGCDDVA
jgi:hypothetical protein